MERETLRIAAVADIHVKKTSAGMLQPLFAKATEQADVILLCGDLTDYGTSEEAKILAKEITTSLRIPVIAVLGNHDLESNNEKEVVSILTDAGVVMLDGDSYELHGVGFAGVKGFAGGFGRRALGAWGEQIIKDFVHEAINESLKLEAALARLRTPQKIAVLHYSPIQATVEGEPLEIVAFLGSSRLEEPIDRYRVNAVFHGHAHRGSPEGRTHGAAPVYNVAMPVLMTNYPDRPPFRIVEIPVGAEVTA
ncbi:MAG TPA: metallophosphoesterase [Thermoanaerobaculia bacterium]